MNFGILLVQRLVDSFGAVTMAAFASPLMKIFVKALGTRVVLAYALADPVGEVGVWIAIPIGWFLADFVGYGYWFFVLPKRITKKRGW